MFLANLPEIYHTLAILHKIISIAWWQENNAQQHYLDFKNDIEILAQNLRVLVDVICEVQNALPQHTPSRPPQVLVGLNQILGSFHETVDQCWLFLEERASHGSNDGAINNLAWHFWGVGDELNRHRDRVVYLNIKLSIALGSLNLSNFGRLQHTLHGIADWIDHRLHQLEGNLIMHTQISQSPVREEAPQIRQTEDENPLIAVQVNQHQTVSRQERSQPIRPNYAANGTFRANVQSLNGRERLELSLQEGQRAPRTSQITIPEPLDQVLTGIARLQHGDPSKIPLANGVDEVVFYLDRATQWHSRRESSESSYGCKMANILRAYWLVNAIRATDEYQNATKDTSFTEFQRQLDDYGMTLPRFLSQLEEKVTHVHGQLLRSQLEQPSVDQLKSVIESEKDRWAIDHQGAGAGKPDPLTRELRCCLIGEKHLEIYKDSGGCLSMLSPVNGTDMMREIDLDTIHVGVSPQSPDFHGLVYPIFFKQNRNSEHRKGVVIQFGSGRDLFKFQEFATGYKVVENISGAQITCQFSRGEQKWKVWEGEQWTKVGRVQLWTSNYRPRTRPGLLDTNSTNDTDLGLLTPTTSIPSIASQAPVLPQFSFARGSRQSVAGTILSAQTNASRRTERSSTGTAPITIVPVDKNGNHGAILEIPDSPSLVLFLPEMLVVVKVNDDINIKPGKCDCLAEESTGNQRCRRVVLKSSRDSIRSSRTPTANPIPGRSIRHPSDFTPEINICSAGRYQQNGLEKLEKLKRVMIDFPSVEERLRFVKFFKQVQDLSRLNQRGVL
ncbi:hypothetical protein B0T16DRAFT_486747 [Cercophora newfieldiana]|uniref:Uncharacterized protein n=1 Tax=Cercophora newfieldiana TaxID=92897 RepID=A0AA39YM95_9PEZI|nr:hypothetical protein B0T16DRAFT_486747 [Cercophora newfieldiana]